MHYLKVEGSSVPFPREAYICQMCIFFNIVQTAFDPPPRFEHVCCKFVTACHDKILQNDAYICGKMSNLPENFDKIEYLQ